MRRQCINYLVSTLCFASALPVSFSVLGQTQLDHMLEEVVVTARKRTESLQDAPLAVSAFSGDALEYRGASNIGQIANFVPNLSFQNNPSFGGSSNSAAVYLRGVGQKEFLPTTEPGVGIYVDGVYVARSVGAILDLVDVERVEVLRGPQGTLFGRNTIGGAISITSAPPTDEFGGKLDLKLGSDSRANAKISVDLPITEKLKSKFSAAIFSQDGYLTRQDGVELGDDDTWTARASLRWDLSDSFTADFSVDYTEDDESGPAMTLLGIAPGTLPSATPAPPIATIYNVVATLMSGGPAAPCAVGGVTTPGLPPVANCYDNSFVQGIGFNAGEADSFSEAELFNASMHLNWDLTENVSFKSITAIRDIESEFSRDGDHAPFVVSQFFDSLEQEQFTQEFQLLGDAVNGRLNWLLGAYYFQEDGDNVNLLDFAISSFRSGGQYDNEATAFFAQGTFDFTDKLSATLGIRYTDESKRFLPDQVILNNPFQGSGDPNLDAPFLAVGTRILPLLEKEISIKETTPMLNVAYQFSEQLMGYATYSEGFKSGGFTQRVFPPVVVPFTAPPGTADIDLIPTFEPEFVEVYELGVKYRSEDGRLTINGAVFQTNYEDMQIQVFTSVAPVTRNAGSATIEGLELEVKALPGADWLLDFSLGYLDASYDEIDTATTLVSQNNELERVPELTASVGISKSFAIGDGGELTPRIDYSYRSEVYNDTFNTELIRQGSYGLLNLRLNWLSSSGQYSVAVGATNLTDDNYLITGVAGDAFQSIEGVFHRGREYYASLTFNF